MVMMQGVLWKWTNYLSGWQPRWFVLDYGVLAYYRSQEEVHLGSRGSVKMSCCEIYVHPTDPIRLDLKIPPENHMYLRAATPAERQQWLVALGTAKACLIDGNYQEHQQQINSVNFLKEKMSELNMCRNIMLQQVQQIKSLCTNKENSKELNEASTMLSATCDTFLSDLSDVMEIIEDNLSTVSGSPVSTPIRINRPTTFRKQNSKERGGTPPSSPSSSIFSDSLTGSEKGNARSPMQLHSLNGSTLAPVQENVVLSPTPSTVTRTTGEATKTMSTLSVNDEAMKRPIELTLTKSTSERQAHAVESSPNATTAAQEPMDSTLYALSQQSLESQSSDESKNDPKSFFASVPTRFEDVNILEDGSIPTKSFLDACSAILPFFDVLGSTTFAPVKIDIQGNIKKLTVKFDTDEEAFTNLQNIVCQEMKSNSCSARNSSTDALLWLKRALEFIQVFLAEVIKGEQDLAVAANTAYNRSLKKYHGWVVRGVFSLAVKAVPYRKDFLEALGSNDKGSVPPETVLKDMNCSVVALGKIVTILNQFYRKHKLDSDATV